MGDVLKYRLPFGTVADKVGSFRRTTLSELNQGFVVSDFEKREVFLFEENGIQSETSVLNRPICYSEEVYLKKAKFFIEKMKEKGLSKAIFSRVKCHASEKTGEELFEALSDAYPSAFVYLISSQLFGTWIGATPERLISSDGGNAETVSLAGTMRAEENEEWGEKEQLEQAFVSEFIEQQLKELSVASIARKGPKDRVAGPVKHLETQFEFLLNGRNPIEIADRLHPTPAVSGLPQKEAIELIHSIEEHKRSLYTGFIGILGEQTNLFVNLRCAQLIDKEYFLYLGGGFTKDSIAEKEWQETENKSRTLLDILENS